MHDGISVIAGVCTITFDGPHVREHTQHGKCVIVLKPDNSVLVHDAEGCQPIAWLSRADRVKIEGSHIVATDGEKYLEIQPHEEFGRASYPASRAGTPVGDCPQCGDQLVRTERTVRCDSCQTDHHIPSDGTVLGEECECGLPRVRVERGRTFEVCIDQDCESLDEQVMDAFDSEWSCPVCGGEMRILQRDGLLARCENHPECRSKFSIPVGTVIDECECGLPVFDTITGRQCLDDRCHFAEV